MTFQNFVKSPLASIITPDFSSRSELSHLIFDVVGCEMAIRDDGGEIRKEKISLDGTQSR
jgi:hypothetical protein